MRGDNRGICPVSEEWLDWVLGSVHDMVEEHAVRLSEDDVWIGAVLTVLGEHLVKASRMVENPLSVTRLKPRLAEACNVTD